MPLPVLVPIGISLALAAIVEGITRRTQPRDKSIEMVTDQFRAMWITENGVVNVYHEIKGSNRAHIVIECRGRTPDNVPGEVDGYPVLVRMCQEFGVDTGPSGVRGGQPFREMTPEEADAARRDQAAQGLRFNSSG